MITLTILCGIILLIGLILIAFATGFLVVFGDVIVAITVIVLLVKLLKGNKKSEKEKVEIEEL